MLVNLTCNSCGKKYKTDVLPIVEDDILVDIRPHTSWDNTEYCSVKCQEEDLEPLTNEDEE